MQSDKVYTVLVAEDENFQRLALLDILSMCDYETVEAENGKIAMEKLCDENYDFNLVLLDLNMPEMNGFEVLTHMQEDQRLSQIPVVVMSGNDSQDVIADCLRMGAVNYLVKPVRIQQCRALIAFMRQKTSTPSSGAEERGLARYEELRLLGRGAAGMVNLIRHKTTGEQFALKTMNTQYMTEKDKRSAECEVEFLRVITGPTIIKFYESFVEGAEIFIVMEYAEGGSLAQLIQKHCLNGKKFTEDQILMYTAQITLSLLALHSKQILHRDLKTQNIFIKNGVLKLGDFGISKALPREEDVAHSILGTPLFMPPEVCKGCAYDSKADIWAMGVIIYELITLKKPFDGDSIQMVFDKIINQPWDPLPDGTSSDLKLLIGALLNKDNNKRYSIFDVAKVPCVNRKI